MNTVLFALWFFLPAGLANAAPVFAHKIPLINRLTHPLDANKKFGKKPIFGKNKTWRGLLAGVIVATVVLWLQQILYQHSLFIQEISQNVNYTALPILILGPLFGLGALLGDAIESFIKRQVNVEPGESWFPFDQIDYIVGGLVAVSLIVNLSLQQYVAIFVIWFAMHLISVYVGYLLGVRKDKI